MTAAYDWQILVATALIGTERRPPAPPTEGPIGALLAGAAHSAPEEVLLHAAAALTQYRRAGRSAAVDANPLPSASAPETRQPCGIQAARQLGQMLSGHQRDLLPEWLDLAAQVNRLAPPLFLPALLELGRTQQTLRGRVLAVVGERGRWLAAQNADWSYAVAGQASGMERWETADRATRLALLQALRTSDPGAARRLIESAWAVEKADDRTAFLGVLETGLDMADEPMLEAALDDRSKEVRRSAANLLARLPESRLSQRMRERVLSLLTWKRRLLRSAVIELRLPDVCDAAMQRDGIENKVHGALGEKAWWLHQMLHAIRPGFWSRSWNATPADLIGAAAQSEWRELLLGAWLAAAARHSDAEWAEALLQSDALPVGAEFETLVSVVPPERRERLVGARLRENAPLAASLLRHCTHAWSARFARDVVAWYRVQAGGARQPNWLVLTLVKESARYVPPALVAECGQDWPIEAPNWQGWQGAVERFLVVLQFRADMHAALAQNTKADEHM